MFAGVKRDKGSLLYGGPTGDVGWQAVDDPAGRFCAAGAAFLPRPTPPLATGPDGALLIQTWNRGASLDLTLPDRVDVEFRVHSDKRPEFTLALGGDPRATLRVETWDDDLVLASDHQFQPIRKNRRQGARGGPARLLGQENAKVLRLRRLGRVDHRLAGGRGNITTTARRGSSCKTKGPRSLARSSLCPNLGRQIAREDSTRSNRTWNWRTAAASPAQSPVERPDSSACRAQPRPLRWPMSMRLCITSEAPQPLQRTRQHWPMMTGPFILGSIASIAGGTARRSRLPSPGNRCQRN